MIILGKKDLRNRKALLERKAYIQSLLGEGRPNAGPSSQEWVSPEYWAGHRQMLLDEVKEINAVLREVPR